ncbi:MAG: alpha/beta hydrolase [Prevotella sp.]|nr:alpha/beta hydrolase [Prevotella sp.]
MRNNDYFCSMKHSFLSLAALLLTLTASAQPLTKRQAETLRLQLVDEWKQTRKAELNSLWNGRRAEDGQLVMPLWAATYGEKPADGRSLWISLHGGGSAPAEVNDQQWENQKHLYRPSEGVYVAPRAPYNDWDMWFKPALDALYEQLIQMAVVFEDVNPDKVYLMGYSAGGDGLWRMAPRMADRWAAASMMAGHPGDVSLLNLRNTPFMIWCGADDEAYNRNRLDAERGLEMDSLRNADPEGYIHETHIMQGMGHWMMRADTAAVAWMQQYRRNPYPKTVVWQQEEVLRPHFYWLSAPTNELQRGQRVRLTVNGNVIDISECSYSQLTLWLNDDLVDLDRKVTVRYQGRKLFRGKLERTGENMRESLFQNGDPRLSFPAKVTVKR